MAIGQRWTSATGRCSCTRRSEPWCMEMLDVQEAPGLFSRELLPSQAAPSLSCWQGLFLPGAGLCTCPRWVSHGSYQSTPSTCLGLNSSPGLEQVDCSPSLVSSAKSMNKHSITSCTSLVKVLDRAGARTAPCVTAHLTGSQAEYCPPLGLTFFCSPDCPSNQMVTP